LVVGKEEEEEWAPRLWVRSRYRKMRGVLWMRWWKGRETAERRRRVARGR
jgi:hypothetical protein